jgi:site-specific DNA recombinase
MNSAIDTKTRRVAIYERVSTFEQRDRGSIKTQADEVVSRLEREPGVQVVNSYEDDGLTGMLPLADRPAGARLLRDLDAGLADEVWVYKLDRLGRDGIDPLGVRKRLARIGVKVCSATEAIEDGFTFAILTALANKEHEVIRERTTAGMNRAAREGRYTGGVVPYGYRVEGEKPRSYLVPSTVVAWQTLTESDVMARIYHHLAVDGWSCRRIADELNALGVPTAEQRPGLGRRGKRTQGLWRAGRIRNMVVNPVYRGELLYGRRADINNYPNRTREVIVASVPPLVPEETWYAAQETLSRNRICAKNSNYRYLLRSKIVCGTCGLSFVGTRAHGTDVWYRCNGYLVERGPVDGRCTSKAVKGDIIEPVIWADIEAWLRDPGPILEKLRAEANTDPATALLDAERITLEAALKEQTLEQDRVRHAFRKGRYSPEEFDQVMDEVDAATKGLQTRLAALQPPSELQDDLGSRDMLQTIRENLDSGLSDEDRQEIIRLLVRRITVYTEVLESGNKSARAVVEYRLPEPDSDVVSTPNGKDSWLRPEYTPPGRQRCPLDARSRHTPPPEAAEGPPAHPERTREARQGTVRLDAQG